MVVSRRVPRLFALPLLLALAACPLRTAPTTTIVSVSTSATTLHGGQTATVSATVTQQTPGMPAPAPAPASTVAFTPSIGSVAPPSPGTNVQGVATTTYTAPPVDRETGVTVNARYGSSSGSTSLTVRPAIGTGNFSGTAGDNVTVTPSVTQLPSGAWRFVYTIQDGAASARLRTVSVGFARPVSLASDTGTVNPATGQSANFAISAINPNQGMTGPIVITVTGDVQPGGTARWDILDVNVTHALTTTTGPAP